MGNARCQCGKMLNTKSRWEKRKRFPFVFVSGAKIYTIYFKNFHTLKLEHILQKTDLVREVADVGEAVPSLTDAGGYLLNRI